MKALLINIFLALVLSGLMGRVTLGGLLASFAAGYVLVWWLRPLFGPTTYFQKVPQTLSLPMYIASRRWKCGRPSSVSRFRAMATRTPSGSPLARSRAPGAPVRSAS